MGHRLLGTTDLSHYLQHNPRLIAGIPLGWWMPGGVGAGVAEPDWRPPGWRGLTGLNEPSYNGGGAQRAGRPGTTDQSRYLQHNPWLIAGIPLGCWMPSGVGAGVDEPGWRPLGWRGLTGLNEPGYNGGGEQRAGRPGTTDLGTTDLSLYLPSTRTRAPLGCGRQSNFKLIGRIIERELELGAGMKTERHPPPGFLPL